MISTANADAAPHRTGAQALRERAENLARTRRENASLANNSPETAAQVLHELEVHQIELELQNEELRSAQLELETAHARYFDLYDLAPVSYLTVSDTHQILEANLTAANLLGIHRSELTRRTLQRFILPADQDIYYLLVQQLVSSGQPQSCELRVSATNCPPRWVLLTVTQVPGDAATHRVVLTDIHERKLSQQHSWLGDVALKAISQGVVITTPDLRVIWANGAFLTMSGYEEHEVVGSSTSMMNGPLTDPQTLAAFRKAIAERKMYSHELVNYRKDGTSFWNELTVSPLYDSRGGLSHFIGINADVSDRKRLDWTLQQTNVELQNAKQAAEAATQVAEKATQVAEKANLAKSDFLSSMSHELRSPLNSILGFAQLLEGGTPALTPTQTGRIEKILQSGWYLLTLINEILDLSLIESGKMSLSLEPLSIDSVMQDCQNMTSSQADSAGIRVKFPQVTDSIFVVADATRIKQVIVNLLSNAIKYNRADGAVDVSVRAVAAGVVRISVRDTGEGLTPEKVSQLFQPFNRLGQELSTKQGTGIGLVVTRRLIELMGGTIGVHSTPGEGSVFWVELASAMAPQRRAAVEDDFAPAHVTLPGPGPARTTVLYIEDNQSNRDLVEQILAGRPDLRLIMAEDADEGIEMARRQQPDLILMDINLPGMNGTQALNVLRQDSNTRHMPVLAFSANAMPGDVIKGLQAGFFCYMTKPIRIHEFLRDIDLALEFLKTRAAR